MILQGGYFFVDVSPKIEIPVEKLEEVARFQRQVDSLKRLGAVKDTFRLYPFNPNFISDFKGYTLGMSVEEIDRLHAFRATDRWINSSVEFQQVTEVSDSLLQKISPYFKFPEWKERRLSEVNPQKGTSNSGSEARRNLPVQDLNAATAEALMQVNGVGEVLSKRIVKYREHIGGFRDVMQLNDVYGLSPEVVARISKSFKLLNSTEIKRQDLNSISVLSLSEIPGFNYQLAREVVEYRTLKQGIQSFEELGNIKGFSVEKIERIQLYLAID